MGPLKAALQQLKKTSMCDTSTLQNVIEGSANTPLCLFFFRFTLKFSLWSITPDIFATLTLVRFIWMYSDRKTVIVLLVSMEIS